jgi:meiotic recombination protein SPO11
MNNSIQRRFFNSQSLKNDTQNMQNNLTFSNSNIICSSSITKLMIHFKEKIYPLLKKFFIDFANKLINDEPIQLAVIDLEKTSFLDYNLGHYSLPLEIDKFKYKYYNLFDNLKTIARILKLSVIIQHKLNHLMPCTKRELYYENVDLFKSTEIIDSNEGDLCSILGICKFDLPIFPSAKGLFCGNITLINKNGNRLNINNSNMNNKINLINYEYLIEDFDLDEKTKTHINLMKNNNTYLANNNNRNISRNSINDLCKKFFVLIIEKETLFFNLVGNYQFFNKFPNAILITGKGYPDYITKVFIRKLSNLLSDIPFIYFGDHDPHGFEIYLNYIFGSAQSSKENSYMCLENINWIGLSHENIEAILKFGLINNEVKKEIYDDGDNNMIITDNDHLNNDNFNQESESGLIKLDNKDKLKIKNILKREYFNSDDNWINSNNLYSDKILANLKIIKNELYLMESSDYKAEGEYLVSKFFSDFLFLVEEAIY